jgi:hypothetical protein
MEIVKEIEVDIEQVVINENDKTFSFRVDLKKL